MSMKPTESVYEIGDDRGSRGSALDYMSDTDMKIIMVKGIGYVVVSRKLENPEIFRRMGEAVAKTFE